MSKTKGVRIIKDVYFCDRTVTGSHFNREGKPNERTPYTHPYSYEPFVVWSKGGKKGNSGVYTDRLLQWDYGKHNQLCRKHFGNQGQYWDQRDPAKIEAFMRDWTGKPTLELVMVEQYCNMSSGYPLWYLEYIVEETET